MGIISQINLIDNYTSTSKKVEGSISSMTSKFKVLERATKKSTSAIKSGLDKLTNKRYEIKLKDINNKKIRQDIGKVSHELKKLSKGGVDLKVTTKNSVSRIQTLKDKIKGVKGKTADIKTKVSGFANALKNFRKVKKELKVMKSPLKIKMSFPAFKKIKEKLKSIGKSMLKLSAKGTLKLFKGVGIGAAALGMAALPVGKKLFDQGSELEGQQISMKHFLGGNEKKSQSYMKALRKEANLTPFSSTEVVGAGTRAIQIAGGDTKKGMQFVKLAEDMAALNPGKTISDAMEALADADMGEMERLKEFGFKGSKKEFDKAGGNLFKMKDTRGKTLQGMYQSGAEKLSKSGAGKVSTIKGNLESGLQDAGKKMLDKMAPFLEKLIPLSETIGTKIPEIFDTIVAKVQPLVEPIKGIIDGVKQAVEPMLPTLSDLGNAIIPLLASVFNYIGEVIKTYVVPAFHVVNAGIQTLIIPAINFVKDVIDGTVIPILKSTADFINTLVIPAFDLIHSTIHGVVVSAFQWLADKVNWLGDAIKGAIDKITSIGSGIKDGITSMWDKLTGGGKKGHATGTNYFEGGLTTINERGEELIDLNRGARIYPEGKTTKLIKEDIKKSNVRRNEKHVNYSPTINIYTNKDDGKDIAKEVDKALRRLAVNV